MRHSLFKAVFGVVLLSVGCDSGDEQEQPIETVEEACLTNTEFFAEKIWWPTLATDCVGCHNSQGAANMSKFVLQSSWQTGFLEHNFEQFKSIAAFEVDSESVILKKPLGELAHGGSQRFTEESDPYENFKLMLDRLEQPISCDDSEKKDETEAVTKISLAATLRKASLNLAGRLPSPSEYQSVEQDGLAGLNSSLDKILSEDAFYDRLKEIYNDKLLTNRYLSGNSGLGVLSDNDYPDREWFEREANAEHEGTYRGRSNYGVAQEPLELIAHVVRNDRPFSEILTADYLMVNSYSARTYGVAMNAIPDGANPEDYDPSQFFEARVDGIPHAGILTSHMFLNRFPTSDTNVNRHRAKILFDYFLATDVMKLADRPVDPTSIEEFNPTLYTPSCAICHAVIDPAAGAFQNWNDRGQYRPPENGWFQDLRPPGIAGKKVPHDGRFTSLQWLAKEISTDSRFATSTVHTWFEALTGRKPVEPPSKVVTESEKDQLKAFELQQREFKKIEDAFRASNQNLKAVIKSLVISPYYRASAIDDNTLGETMNASFGTARLLTPEMLSRKITAVTGIEWTRYGRNLLTHGNEYLYFYGGIDSNRITQRIVIPNGIMANIAQRMANEIACRAVSRDFVRETESRILFPLTEREYLPEDENGFMIEEATQLVKSNIKYLHRQLLGEELSLTDEEIELTYQLFYETWKEGRDGVVEGTYDDDLPRDCRVTRHPDTNEELPREDQISRDRTYIVRAWMAVVSYMLSDIEFLYE